MALEHTPSSLRAFATALLLCGLTGACSSEDPGTSAGGGSTISAGGGGAGGGGTNGGHGGALPLTGPVWVHGPNLLYRLDPDSTELQRVGPFDGCSGVLDIAVRGQDELFVTTDKGLFRVDAATAECQLIAPAVDSHYVNALAFMPAGTVDPQSDALVGYIGQDYVRIDRATGTRTTITAEALPGEYEPSGDLTAMLDGNAYLTIMGGDCADCLGLIDPATGILLEQLGPLGHDELWGLAGWGGALYAASGAGQILRIDIGEELSVEVLPVLDIPANLQFWGAGSAP